MPANQREYVVEIKLNDKGQIIAPKKTDRFVVHKHNDQEVRWNCTPAKNFMVEFNPNDCPFYEYQFSQDYPCSGLVRRNVVPDWSKNYEYTIRVGDQVLDPGGGIEK